MKTTLQVFQSHCHAGYVVNVLKEENGKTYASDIYIGEWKELSDGEMLPIGLVVKNISVDDSITNTSSVAESKGEVKALKEEIKYLREQISKLLDRV